MQTLGSYRENKSVDIYCDVLCPMRTIKQLQCMRGSLRFLLLIFCVKCEFVGKWRSALPFLRVSFAFLSV